jgi:penicillin-binding protein A
MIHRVRLAARRRWWLLCAVLCALLGAGAAIALNSLPREAPQPDTSSPQPVATPAQPDPNAPPPEPPPEEPKPAAPVDPLAGVQLDPTKFEREGDGYVQRLSDGRVVYLTLRPEVQGAVEKLFDQRKVPHGGLVAVEPATGRVLAMVSRSYASNPSHLMALRASAPAASVFKMISAAALLEKANLDPARKVCYSGGLSHLTPDIIKGTPGADAKCGDLGDALAHSINAVIARLSYYHLTRAHLEEMALRFGFNREIPFELPVDVSTATFVDDDIERARTAAGFWNVNLSPLHGALIAAAISNDGIMMRPTLISRIASADGALLYEHTPQPWLVPIQPAHARVLATLGEATTTVGTAAAGFHKDKSFPKDLHVTGKTGTLSNKKPHLTYTWFVGASPVLQAEIAVGSLVVNTPKWWIKGFHGAATAFKAFDQAKSGGAAEKPSKKKRKAKGDK